MARIDRSRVQAALPDYEIGDAIGQGAFGTVFAAAQSPLRLAVKCLDLAQSDDPDSRRRFELEARTLASIEHPHVVRIHAYREIDGLCMIVMDLLEGGSLADRYRTAAPSVADVCAIGMATCSALQAAHDEQVLHRDIKPANLLFTGADVLKVTDFGVAKIMGSAGLHTSTGVYYGTPAFMAPEQVLGHTLVPATDIYATATVLYWLLSGRYPISAEGRPDVVAARRLNATPVPLGDITAIDGPLPHEIMAALAAAPEDRYPSAEAFGVELAHAAHETLGPGWYGDTAIKLKHPDTIFEALLQPRGRAAPTSRGGGSEAPTEMVTRQTPPGATDTTPDPNAKATVTWGAAQTVTASPPPSQDPQAGVGGPVGTRGHRRRSRLIAAGAALVVLAAVAIGVGIAHNGHGKNPILQAIAAANNQMIPANQLPPSSCHQQSTSVYECNHPVPPSIVSVRLQTFTSRPALYDAYIKTAGALTNRPFVPNRLGCDINGAIAGEETWNTTNGGQRTISYSIAQLESAYTNKNDAGRVFCTTVGKTWYFLWTTNDGKLLGLVSGGSFTKVESWWHQAHHALEVGGGSDDR